MCTPHHRRKHRRGHHRCCSAWATACCSSFWFRRSSAICPSRMSRALTIACGHGRQAKPPLRVVLSHALSAVLLHPASAPLSMSVGTAGEVGRLQADAGPGPLQSLAHSTTTFPDFLPRICNLNFTQLQRRTARAARTSIDREVEDSAILSARAGGRAGAPDGAAAAASGGPPSLWYPIRPSRLAYT